MCHYTSCSSRAFCQNHQPKVDCFSLLEVDTSFSSLTNPYSICSFIGRLFQHALEDSRPKSVLVNSLCVCISLLDPKRLTFGVYHTYNRQMTNGSAVAANPETVEGMLESLGKTSSFDLDFQINCYF